MKRIVIHRQDGGISVMCLTDIGDIQTEIDRWKLTNPGYVSHEEVPFDDTPPREFRNAYKRENGQYVTDPVILEELNMRKAFEEKKKREALAVRDLEYQNFKTELKATLSGT